MTNANNQNTSKRLYIRTFGCQMNIRDSEVICGLLKRQGYIFTDKPEGADIILFNTCSVRQHAEDRVWSEIGRIAKVKGQSPKAGNILANSGTVPIIGLVGCMAQNYKENIFARAPQVDFVVGPRDIHKIPEILENIAKSKLWEKKVYETGGEFKPDAIYHTGFFVDKKHAYVAISEGCSNYCSYCVVPYVRGPLQNRNYKDISREIDEAIDRGITKITLLGQNVNAYKYNGVSFTRLIELVNSKKGLRSFSFITSHPKDTSVDLFKVMADLQKLKKYLHLPVQSGSDRILELMNRGYTKNFYLNLINDYRKIVKDGVLTTDIIVGFPTENEGDFQDTYNLVKGIEFNAAYIFKYSSRPHTEAEKLVDDVAQKEKESRHRLILELQKKISKNKIVNDK